LVLGFEGSFSLIEADFTGQQARLYFLISWVGSRIQAFEPQTGFRIFKSLLTEL